MGKNNGKRSKQNDNSRSAGRKRSPLKVFLVLAIIVVLAAAGVYAASIISTQISNSNILASEKIYDGVFVDDIPLGGMTRDQARKKIEEKQQDAMKTTGISIIDLNNNETPLMVADLPDGAYSFDTESILDQAFAVGRNQNDTEEARLAYIEQLPSNPVGFTTTLTITDPSAFHQTVIDLTAPFYVAPQDAAFDPNGYDATKEGIERLSFTPEVPGSQVNPDRLWEAVQAEFLNQTFNNIQMTTEPVEPAITLADVQADFQLVQISPITIGNSSENKTLNTANEGHTYTTQIFDHSNARLTNISLANEAVSGLVMPGEVFSMNERTGNRTAAQGYQVAPIDRSGVVDRGLGGGVCQVSGTLYNAAIRYGGKYEVDSSETNTETPGLAITARDTHSLPSAYLHTGTDATVDISSGKDIQFRNDFDTPVLVILYYDKNDKGQYFEHCDIYGPALPDGATYDLIRKNSKTIPADTATPPKTVYSKYAEPGNPVYIAPRNGYSVDVYIEKNVNGEKTQTFGYTSSYAPQTARYYIYVGETAPTPTPSPTIPPTEAPATPTAPPATATPTIAPTATAAP